MTEAEYVTNLRRENSRAYDAGYAAARAEIERLRATLKPFAELADRKEYTLDDVPHSLFIDAKLAYHGLRVVSGISEQKGSK